MVRVRVIDMMRGISMAYIVFGHLVQWWIAPSDFWIFSFVFTMSECMGANAFLFVSGVAFTFSVRSREEKALRNPDALMPPLWKDTHARTLFIFIFSLIFNVGGGHWLWTWFILQTIAVSRIMMLPLMKTTPMTRMGVTTLVVIGTPLLYAYLVPQSGASLAQVVAFEALFHVPYLDVIFPFFGFFVGGTVAGDLFWARRDALNEKGYAELSHVFLRVGGVLFATGIFTGMFVTDWDLGWATVEYINLHPWWNFPGLPLFLIRGSPPWMLMSLGVILSVLAFLCAVQRFPRLRETDMRFLSVLSAQSLTIYFLHHVGFPMFTIALDIYNLWMVDVAFVMFMWALAWIWVKKYNGKYSIEWMIGRGVQALLRNYYRKPAKSQKGT